MYDAKILVNYLAERGIAFLVEKHPRTYTAMETAAAEAVSGKRFAKSVVVMAGGKPVLAVLPAHLKVDLDKLSRLSGKTTLRIAHEREIAALFPDCEIGAMPPFGRLYSLPVYIDDDIAVAPEVTFNACSHEHTITMSGKNFLKAAESLVGDISKD